jgi:predicted metalloprotease with PDZ domain
MSPRSATIAVLFSLASLAGADINYIVTIQPSGATPARMTVSLDIPVESAATVLQIPNWGPGSYGYSDYWKNVQDVKAMGKGKEIEPTKPNDYTWTIPTAGLGTVRVTYTVPMQISEEMGHYRGPSTYMYVAGRKHEKCNLMIDLPKGWKIATGLDGMPPGKTRLGTPGTFDDDQGFYSAPNYDVLADNPVTYGKYRELRYTVDGKPHIIAMYGAARNDVDTDFLLKACSFISAMENDLFGNKPPYTHYVWHFNVGKRPDGGGGLEHLASTEITLANGLGPGIIGVNAHEFFHLWNVKRIRSRVLGPFDYTKLPETGALWWLEGVTEYYAHELMTRYGYWDDKKWYATVITNLNAVRSNPAHLEVGPYESSFRVKDAANGRGNSNGYKISYYNLGVLVGLCLDIEIISQTKGRRSLDDVERALWDECKGDQPGFAEDEIRNQCVRFGGPALGDMYDRIVMHAGEMPIEEQLAKVGLKLVTFNKDFTDIGATMSLSRQAGGMAISSVSTPGDAKLKVGDIVQEVNGVAITSGGTLTAVVGKIKPGDTVNFKVKRDDKIVEIAITAGTVSRPTTEIHEDPSATADQVKLRNIWLYRGKKGWKPPAVK